MRKYTHWLSIPAISFVVLCAFLTSCAQLRPGADPLVIRAEQTESAAKVTFDLVLNIDNADRGFWRTNAPAFHNFVEWLRQPQIVWPPNVLPRASAMILSLNTIKVEYALSLQSSNALVSAIAVLQSAATEANAWSIVITNRSIR